jgi:hypothetical protein
MLCAAHSTVRRLNFQPSLDVHCSGSRSRKKLALRCQLDVRFGSPAAATIATCGVRFAPESGLKSERSARQLRANAKGTPV